MHSFIQFRKSFKFYTSSIKMLFLCNPMIPLPMIQHHFFFQILVKANFSENITDII